MAESSINGTPTRRKSNGGPLPTHAVSSSPDKFSTDDVTPIRFEHEPADLFKVPPPLPSSGDNDPQQSKDITQDSSTKKKQLRQMTSIEQAKDRAQITASTAMSIVQVALLKDVIDAGPVGNKYYYWSLGFILTALILQVLSGFIALYIALLRYYYTEYKDDFLDDCCKTCCPWRLRRTPHRHNTVNEWIKQPISAVRKKKKKYARLPKPINIADEEDCDSDPEVAGCCGAYECTTMRYADFEYEVLDMYDNMTEQVIKADIQTANFEKELKWLIDKVTRLNNELQKYEALDVTDEVTSSEYLQKMKDQLLEAQAMREEMEDKNRYAKQLRAQGNILEHHVEIIQEERVLKKATFWQNWLNMMLYTVFVLNAVIAGIGLANPKVIVGNNATVG